MSLSQGSEGVVDHGNSCDGEMASRLNGREDR